MKSHSIQSKFLIIIISAMLVVAFFIGGLSIVELGRFVQTSTENLIEITAQKEAVQINSVFDGMEKSVKIMESYVMDFITGKEQVSNRDFQNMVIEKTDEMFIDVADNTRGAVAYYMRFAPAISNNTTGLFYSKIKGEEGFIKLPVTDLSLYPKDDTEHVGWYWQAYDSGKPVWMSPYYNKNNDILMISYVIPLYFDGSFIGIVGMDFDYSVLTKRVDTIKMYQNGFAYLEIDEHIAYHRELEPGTPVPNISGQYMQVSKELSNGMSLVISVDYNDIREIRYNIYNKIILGVAILTTLFSIIVILIVRKIVRPLKKLTESAEKLNGENYNVEIIHSNTSEVELLSTAFQKMAMRLGEHSRLQHQLAFRDSLTGLRNTNSYKAWVSDFDREIKKSPNHFGVVVLDLNYLKETNDTYGHDAGNKLLAASSGIISGTFKRSPVFRIGGDEFLIILQNYDLQNYKELINKFEEECKNEFVELGKNKVSISIAKGVSIYNPATDTCFADVFNRADDAMYKNKRSMKGISQ